MKIQLRDLLVLGVALAATASYGSTRKQVFPATEEGPSLEVISSAPGYRGQAAEDLGNPAPEPAPIATEEAAPEAPEQAQEELPAPPQPRAEVKTIAPADASELTPKIPSAAYDTVPASQVEPLLRRLQIAEALISKYGRAYDYRSLTVTQMELILGQLDKQAAEASELRERIEDRSELKKEVRAEENSVAQPEDNSIGSAAPDEYIPAPTE